MVFSIKSIKENEYPNCTITTYMCKHCAWIRKVRTYQNKDFKDILRKIRGEIMGAVKILKGVYDYKGYKI